MTDQEAIDPPPDGFLRERETEENKLTLICKVPGGKPPSTAKPYASHPDLRPRAIELLLEGKNLSKVAELLNVWPNNISHHVKRAIEAGEIIKKDDFYPPLYEKGPRFGSEVYKYRRRRRSPQFVNPLCRVHAGNGSSFRFEVLREGDLDTLILPKGERQALFPKNPVGKKGSKHFKAKLPLPPELAGSEGAAVTMVFFPSPDPKTPGGRLELSPPELLLSRDRLQAISDRSPLQPIIEYTIKILSKHGGWKIGELTYQGGEVHYAFPRSMVDPLLPGFMDSPEVHILRKGEREADYPLFRDLSHPEIDLGGELETTRHDVALDILARLEEAYHQRTAGR